MKLKLKPKGYQFVLIAVLIISSSIVITFQGELSLIGNSNQTELYQLTKISEAELKSSTVSGKISVNGNSGWIILKNAGKCTGLGTSSDPYVIKNLEIDGGGTGSCILIEYSDVYFNIENCTLYNSGGLWGNGGIKMLNVDNGVIIDNTVNDTYYGITLQYCINNDVIRNNLSNVDLDGIHLSNSKNNLISENYLVTVPWGISLHSSESNTISKNDIEYSSSIGIELYGSNNNNIFENTITGDSLGIYLNEESICNTVSNNVYNGNGQAIADDQGMCPEENFLPQIIGIIIGIICITIIVGGFIIKRRFSKNEVSRFKKHAKREDEKSGLVEKGEESRS